MTSVNARGLSGAAQETFWCLFAHGPTWDGDVPSKMGRDELVELGMAARHDGYQWLTELGATIAIDCGYGERKEAWLRQRAGKA